MTLILNREQVREVDQRAIRDYGMTSLVLMENAGRGCADVLCALKPQGRIAILCGNVVTWCVAIVIVLIGGPADEALGDEEESKLSDAQRAFFNASLYATLPLLALITLAMLHQVAIVYQTVAALIIPSCFG